MNVWRAAEYRTLIVAFGVAIALNVLLLLALALSKVIRERREALAGCLRDRLAEALVPFIESDAPFSVEGRIATIGEDRVSLPPPHGLHGETTLETIVGFLAAIKGEGRERLVRILESAGYVDATIRRLYARSPLERARAASILGGSYSPQATAPLTERFLNDPSPEVRIVCAEALGAIGGAPSAELLLQAAREPTRYQELRIANVLSRMGALAVPALQRVLDDPDERIVTLALDVLIDIGMLFEPEALVRTLAHPSPEIRARSAQLLGSCGYVEGVEALVLATRDPVWFVRVRIAKALLQLGVPDRAAARDRYYAALTHLLYDDRWHVRRNAAAALAAAGERGMQALRDAGTPESAAALRLHRLHRGRLVPTLT